jgi:hypothetical protein
VYHGVYDNVFEVKLNEAVVHVQIVTKIQCGRRERVHGVLMAALHEVAPALLGAEAQAIHVASLYSSVQHELPAP